MRDFGIVGVEVREKLLKILATRHPSWALPTRCVACALLKRHGLVRRKTTRRVSTGQAPDPGAEPRMVRGLQRPFQAMDSTAIRSP
jgi:hypothetical protein